MSGYVCMSCGAQHAERPTAFGYPLPDAVHAVPQEARSGRVSVNRDLCILDKQHWFISGNLDIPVAGSAEFVRFTVWSTLSQANFARACDLWTTAGRESEPPYFGWLSNAIPGYAGTLNLPLQVHTSAVGVRPRLTVTDAAHPLATDQRDGIGPQRADELIDLALGRGR